VNTTAIGKQLVAELKRSPKKAAILGTLLVVAVWFWAPLVQGWLPGESSDREAPKKDTVADASDTGTKVDSPQNDKKTTKQESWRKVAQWIAADRRKQPAKLPTNMHTNPFGLVDPVLTAKAPEDNEEEEDNEEAAEPTTIIEVTPQSLGLQLTGTLVGRRTRLATIGGRTYRQGDKLRVTRNTQSGESYQPSREVDNETPIVFDVRIVDVNSAVLARGNKEYELRLNRFPASQEGYAVVRNQMETQP